MKHETLHLADYIIIALALAVSLTIGIRFSKGQNSTKKYFVSRGSLPAWAIGMSLMATLISSVTFLAYPGEGFSSNWILLVQGLMVPVVLLLIVWFIVPLYREVIGVSTYEYFEKRFGSFARFYSSISFVLTHFSKMGTVFFLLALALANMTDTNTYAIIWIIGFVIIVITLIGGIEAVIWADVVQGFLLIGGGIVSFIILICSIKGGLPQLWHIASINHKNNFGPYTWDFKKLTFIVMAINGAFYAIQKYGTDQTMVQRYLTAKTDKAAIRASIMGVALTVPLWALFMFIGTALFAFYQQNPLPAGIKADAVFPYFIMSKLPTGVVGLILAALISAAISSLGADLNCLSAIGVEDYYKKLRPNKTDKEYLKAGRWIVVIAGIGAIMIASLYLLAGDEGALGIVFTLYAIFSGGIAGIFLLGLFSSRANRQGLNIGIAACIVFTAYAFLTSTKIGLGTDKHILVDLGKYNFNQHKYMLGVYSHLVVIIVGSIASLFWPKPDINKNLLFSGWLEAKRAGKLSN
ncbi:sodium:solute symporter [Mucilaginibacter sp. OK283]|uniref:sodium:solute symporter n=1 Tax=Mucilaginibacter sp. OK283 TaxID=1881049 RepID=UPI0008B0A493|nr:sodium:solute symporter [Mucilaginibacter sp. OK283]SEP46222.1 solute:Na+ symporter, SSS family [Mucilaginibacter sp. OK283]